MADESSTRLEISFQLQSADIDTRLVGGYGNLRFENGDAFLKAAEWQGVLLHDFLWRAIEEYLAEVQAAMNEEQAGVS